MKSILAICRWKTLAFGLIAAALGFVGSGLAAWDTSARIMATADHGTKIGVQLATTATDDSGAILTATFDTSRLAAPAFASDPHFDSTALPATCTDASAPFRLYTAYGDMAGSSFTKAATDGGHGKMAMYDGSSGDPRLPAEIDII